MTELPPRSFAELREWEAGLDPDGLAGFVSRTSRTARRLAAGENLQFETLREEKDREWAEERRNKLTDDEVRMVRELRANGVSGHKVAALVKRDHKTIKNITDGVTYKGVK